MNAPNSESNSDTDNPTEEQTRSIHACKTREEAQGIASFLEDQGQTFVMRSFKDSAYPGIVDRGHAWGEICVPASEEDNARQLIQAWLSAEPVGSLDEAATSAAYPAIKDSAASGVPWPFFAIAAVFVVAALTVSDCL